MFTRDQLQTDDQVEEDGSGMTITNVAQAIGVWAGMNWEKDKGYPTVAACAMAFNTSVDLVREAVIEHYWLFLSPEIEGDPTKQTIEHDGA